MNLENIAPITELELDTEHKKRLATRLKAREAK